MATAAGQGKGFCAAGGRSDDSIEGLKNMGAKSNEGQQFVIIKRDCAAALMTLPEVLWKDVFICAKRGADSLGGNGRQRETTGLQSLCLVCLAEACMV